MMTTVDGSPICLCVIVCSVLQILCTSCVSSSWSEWGLYGDCSRPCGGGIKNKTRTCEGDADQCLGPDTRYKICNTHLCKSGESDLRIIQCKSYNNVSLHGNYFHWEPHLSPEEPCVLYCKAVETGSVLKIQPTVANGTSCRGQQQHAVCLIGKCLDVGCDGVVGSSKSQDKCGVCGGDGDSCTDKAVKHVTSESKEQYQWEVRWSPCSATCGSGNQHSNITCVDREGTVVVDDLCQMRSKPRSKTKECLSPECHYRWHAFKWSHCSQTCDEGTRHRRVVCLEVTSKSRRHTPVNAGNCTEVKPPTSSTCSEGKCPEWLAGPWTPCSVSCGTGEQKRKVLCASLTGASCDPELKPKHKQPCGGQPCSEPDSYSSSHQYMSPGDLLDSLYRTPRYQVSPWGPCSVTCGTGVKTRSVVCKISSSFSAPEEIVPNEKCTGSQPHTQTVCVEAKCPSSELSVMGPYRWQHGRFAECNKSCGGGQQWSIMDCVNTDSNTIVDDYWCFGLLKPSPLVKDCNNVPCPPRWELGDYTKCSVPCGGGIQRRTVDCVQDSKNGNKLPVATFRCPDPMPISERPCNLQFCQAEWSTGDWGSCSVTCGLGSQRRSVFCKKVVVSGHTVNVSNLECLATRPSPSRECHLGECYSGVSDLPAIRSENATYIQIKRMKRVMLKVGETAILLPNQQVKVKCPVKNFHRKLIFWTKNHRLIPMVGRVRVSSNGALKISRADPRVDKGTYTCLAGLLQGDVNIDFQSKTDAKEQAEDVLRNLFEDNFNQSFINRPQADEMLKKTKLKNSIHGSKHELDYMSFSMTNWSECSSTCGEGLQKRQVTCHHITDRYIKLLSDHACLKKGMEKPVSIQKCVVNDVCPEWIASEWTPCLITFCSRNGVATMKRKVTCEYWNGTLAKFALCDHTTQPHDREDCSNRDCVAVWKTSRWSPCLPECGKIGEKVRSLSCIWAATKTPAQDTCRSKPRPVTAKTCKPKKCKSDCYDSSTHCNLAGKLKMCRYRKFRNQCCATCRNFNLYSG